MSQKGEFDKDGYFWPDPPPPPIPSREGRPSLASILGKQYIYSPQHSHSETKHEPNLSATPSKPILKNLVNANWPTTYTYINKK